MGHINKLPLIRGWTWRIERRTATVRLNQELLIYQPPPPTKEIGWGVAVYIAGNDAYLGLRVVQPGMDSGYETFQSMLDIGAVESPPVGGYLTRYNRPNPLRTWGQFAMNAIADESGAFYGPVRYYLSLRPGTTEPHATAVIRIYQIIIQNRSLFLKDYRKVLYGRWAPLVDLVGHVPILRMLTKKLEDLDIRFEEKEIVEPPGLAR